LKNQAAQIIEDAKKAAKNLIDKATAETRNVVDVIVLQYESYKNIPDAEKRLINYGIGLREAIVETLKDLGVAGERRDLGEVDERGEPPPVLELVWKRADRRAEQKNERINVPNNTPGMGR
jgi:hypothetical protein